MTLRLLLAAVLAASLPAWAAPPAGQPGPGVASGAPAKLPLSQTGVRNLDLYADGASLHLLYAEQAADGAHSLWHRRSDDAGRGWSAPVRVDAPGQRVFPAHTGGEAQVAARGSRVVAAWTGYGSGWGGAGPIVIAVSEDSGRTWRPGPNPADDASTQGHAFLDLAATREGFHLVWLDNRAGPQGLRHARSADPGHAWSPNATVEPKTCACCWNALLPGAGRSLYLLYRADSPRDMALAASPDEGASWARYGAVGSFGWEAKSCPHTGGGLALTGSGSAQTLHASVWTGREGAAGLYYLASTDGGATWSEPRRLGGEDARHSDLAAAKDGTVSAVWDEIAEGRYAVFRSLSKDGGRSWSEPQRLSDTGAHATRPRVVAAGGRFMVFWTEARDDRRGALMVDGKPLP